MNAISTVIKTQSGKVTTYFFSGIEKTTEKAMLVDIFHINPNETIGNSKKVWMPKSQVRIEGENMVIADWLESKLFSSVANA